MSGSETLHIWVLKHDRFDIWIMTFARFYTFCSHIEKWVILISVVGGKWFLWCLRSFLACCVNWNNLKTKELCSATANICEHIDVVNVLFTERGYSPHLNLKNKIEGSGVFRSVFFWQAGPSGCSWVNPTCWSTRFSQWKSNKRL